MNKEGFETIDSVCGDIAAEIDVFGPGAGVILGRIMRNVGPLRDMASDAYKARISRVLATSPTDGEVADNIAAKLLAQL